MACLSNTPSFTYVSVQNMVIFSDNIYYSVKNMYSNDKYFYWDKTENPYVLKTSNKLLESKVGLYLVVVNNKGTFILPNQTEIVINFDDRGSNSTGSISNLIGKVDELEKKYVNISQTIDAITTNIGSLRETVNGSSTLYTEMKQTANEIRLMTESIGKQYDQDNVENQLRQKIIGCAISLNTSFSNLLKKVREISSDGIISDSENLELIQEVNNLDEIKLQFDSHTEQLLEIMKVNNRRDDYEVLKSQREGLNVAYDSLKTILHTTSNDRILTYTEISTIIGAITNCTTKLTELKNTCSDFLFLGIGGTLYEEIAKLNMEKDKINLVLKSVSTVMKNAFSLEKSTVQSQYEDILTTLTELQDWIIDSSQDGTISNLEYDILTERKQNFIRQNNDFIEKYVDLHDVFLLDEEKFIKLESSYRDYYSASTIMLNYLDAICEDRYFNSNERDKINSYLESTRIRLMAFHSNLLYCLSESEQNKYEEEIESAKAEFGVQLQEADNQLSELETTINSTFLDNIIDKVEKASVETVLNTLKIQKDNIQSQYNKLISSECFQEPNDISIDLTNKYTAFINKYNDLNTTITNILNKTELVTDNDKLTVDTLNSEILVTMSEYVTSANNALIYISNNEANAINDNLQNKISSIEDKVDGLEQDYSTSFNDNIIDATERETASFRKKMLENEHNDIELKYNEIYNSNNLDNTQKTVLRNKYTPYLNAYVNLINYIDEILNKEGLVNNDDRELLNIKIDIFNNALATLSEELSSCSNLIIDEKIRLSTLDYDTRITNIENNIGDMGELVEEAIKDDILTESEKEILKETLRSINEDRLAILKDFNTVYNMLKELPLERKSFLMAHNSLVQVAIVNLFDAINSMVNATGMISATQRETYTNAYNIYIETLTGYRQKYSDILIRFSEHKKNIEKSILSKETNEIIQSLLGLQDIMIDIFDDAYLTQNEKKSLIDKANKLESDNQLLDDRISRISPYLPQEELTNLLNLFNICSQRNLELQNKIVEIAQRTDMLSDTDRDAFIPFIINYEQSLADFSELFYECSQDSVISFVNKTKEDLTNAVSDIDGSVTSLQNEMNGIFKDSILTESERISIKESLRLLEIEKYDIDEGYESIINNPDLVDEYDEVIYNNGEKSTNNIKPLAKTRLTSAYNNYCNAHQSLVSCITSLVEDTGLIDDNDRNILSNAFDSYRDKLSIYKVRLNEAIDFIATKKMNDEKTLRVEQVQGIENKIGEISIYATMVRSDLESFKQTTNNTLVTLTPTGIINGIYETTDENGQLTFFKKAEFKQEIDKYTITFAKKSEVDELLNNNITEFSSKGITVKMYSEEDFDENGDIIENSTPIATSNMNGQGISLYKEEGTPIAFFNSDECFVDNISVQDIECKNIIKTSKYTDIPLVWYVVQNGTGDMSGKNNLNKSDSINNVLETIKTEYGTYLGEKEIQINIEGGEYNEEINICGFLGTGKIILNFSSDSILYGTINVFDNTVSVILNGQKTFSSNVGATIYSYQSSEQNGITVRNCYCQIKGFKAKNISTSGTDYSGAFVKFENGATGSVENCDVIYYKYGILATYSSHGGMWNCRGKVQYRRSATMGSLIITGGDVPLSDNGDSINRGLIHTSGTLRENASLGWYTGYTGDSGGTGGNTGGETQPGGTSENQDGTQTKTITQTFTLTNLRSTVEGEGIGTSAFSGKVGQGKWGSYKLHRGRATLPNNALEFIQSANTIESVSLTCHRLNTAHGYGGAVPYPVIRVYNTNDKTSSSYYSDSSIKFARGDTKTIPIENTSIKDKLKLGANELQFYTSTNPTNQYSQYDKVKLTITITKTVG